MHNSIRLLVLATIFQSLGCTLLVGGATDVQSKHSSGGLSASSANGSGASISFSDQPSSPPPYSDNAQQPSVAKSTSRPPVAGLTVEELRVERLAQAEARRERDLRFAEVQREVAEKLQHQQEDLVAAASYHAKQNATNNVQFAHAVENVVPPANNFNSHDSLRTNVVTRHLSDDSSEEVSVESNSGSTSHSSIDGRYQLWMITIVVIAISGITWPIAKNHFGWTLLRQRASQSDLYANSTTAADSQCHASEQETAKDSLVEDEVATSEVATVEAATSEAATVEVATVESIKEKTTADVVVQPLDNLNARSELLSQYRSSDSVQENHVGTNDLPTGFDRSWSSDLAAPSADYSVDCIAMWDESSLEKATKLLSTVVPEAKPEPIIDTPTEVVATLVKNDCIDKTTQDVVDSEPQHILASASDTASDLPVPLAKIDSARSISLLRLPAPRLKVSRVARRATSSLELIVYQPKTSESAKATSQTSNSNHIIGYLPAPKRKDALALLKLPYRAKRSACKKSSERPDANCSETGDDRVVLQPSTALIVYGSKDQTCPQDRNPQLPTAPRRKLAGFVVLYDEDAAGNQSRRVMLVESYQLMNQGELKAKVVRVG